MSPLLRAPGTLRPFPGQSDRAEDVMRRYADYAREVGCEVSGDEIVATAAQARLLREWWTREHEK